MIFFLALTALALAVLVVSGLVIASRRTGPWSAVLVALLLVFLAVWAGGVGLFGLGGTPGVGGAGGAGGSVWPVWAVYWIPFLAMGTLFACLVVALPPSRTVQSDAERRRDVREGRKPPRSTLLTVWLVVMIFTWAIAMGAGYVVLVVGPSRP